MLSDQGVDQTASMVVGLLQGGYRWEKVTSMSLSVNDGGRAAEEAVAR